MRLILKGLAALTVLIMLTCDVLWSRSSMAEQAPYKGQNLVRIQAGLPQMDPMTRQVIVGYTKLMAEKYHVDPAFALAVAHVESRKGNQEFRIGRLGTSRYFGPFGINKCFLQKWPVDDLFCNIEVGCKALRGSQARVLRRYNSEYNPEYGKAVRQAQKDYGRER